MYGLISAKTDEEVSNNAISNLDAFMTILHNFIMYFKYINLISKQFNCSLCVV